MAEAALERPASPPRPWLVIAGAALGTLFEWYDFFLYGSLATYIAAHFFSGVDERTGFTLALAAFAAGFIARPFGALAFGRIGDIVGRKNTFLVTMTIMGAATFAVGLLPGRDTLGVAAPILLVVLRLLQGLAVGGEYGGAAIYVAEHAPPDRRARDTAWINGMGSAGLITSLLVIMACRLALPEAAFKAWGWRLPFLLSALLLAISLWIRLRLEESPVFARMKAEAGASRAPLSEVFGRWTNLRKVLALLLGACAGSTCVWYTAQFYSLFFLQRVLKVGDLQAYGLIALSLVVAVPAYVTLGWLADKVGRKGVILAGSALAAALIFPAFHGLTWAANPALAAAQAKAPVTVLADPATCSFQFDPVGGNRFDRSGCDIAKAFLSRAGIGYRSEDRPDVVSQVRVGGAALASPDPAAPTAEARKAAAEAFAGQAKALLAAAGYPDAADPARVNAPEVIAIVFGLIVLAGATYAPIAAMGVELFPTRIRYTALSFPYHLGSGWVGGLLPATAFAIVAANGDLYAGLWYPVIICTVSVLIGLFALPETKGRPIE